MVRKEIHGHKYAVCGTALIDTVPAAFSDERLQKAPISLYATSYNSDEEMTNKLKRVRGIR